MSINFNKPVGFRLGLPWMGWALVVLVMLCCGRKNEPQNEILRPEAIAGAAPAVLFYPVVHDVPIRTYFEYMDSLAAHLDSTLNYPVDEYLIALANPWLIDTLAHTDYYYLMSKGIFNEDSQKLPALRKGEKLLIPDSLQADSLKKMLESIVIDINIPEFKLRIIENSRVLYTFPVRVGRVQQKYLAMAGRKVDLRTKTGTGKVIRVNRSPTFINPGNNKKYYTTKRDDGKMTKLPRTPWIEPELDGHRYGQLIHPTTNPETLGKAYSNGCIGMKEGDMWRLYYHAPVGTTVVVRYDLQGIDEKGDSILLKNIYPGFEQLDKRRKIIAAALAQFQVSGENPPSVCECGIIAQ